MAKKTGVKVANKQIKIAGGKVTLNFDVIVPMAAYAKVDKKNSDIVYFVTKELNRVATKAKKGISTYIKENYR